jgi:transposase
MLKETYYTAPTELDELIFAKLVPADHYLRQVKAVVDFTSVRRLVAEYYSPDQGRGADDPVLLFKLCFLQFHYNLSDRDVLKAAQVNVAYRFFLDLSVESKLPTSGLLSQFRTRLGAAAFEAIFADLVRQAREHGLIKDRLRLKDATHVLANIAIPTTLQLVAQVRQRLLAAARVFAPEEVLAHEGAAAAVRASSADLKDQERLLLRVTHLREIVAWADALLARESEAARAGQRLGTQDELQALQAALGMAHKVLADREPEATDKMVSLVDTEARNGRHGDYFDGYLLDLSADADSELICAINLLPGNGNEGADAVTLVQKEEAAQGNEVESVSLDGIGFRGPTLQALEDDPEGPQVRVYTPPQDWPQEAPGLFPAGDFKLNETGDELRCPQGETTRLRYRTKEGTGWRFEFRTKQCRDCPLREKCLKPGDTRPRRVTKNDYEAQYRRARERAQTDAYKEVRQVHPRIERKLGEMVRWHAGRRCRYRGRLRSLAQYLLIAFVVNAKRIVRLLHSPLATQPA